MKSNKKFFYFLIPLACLLAIWWHNSNLFEKANPSGKFMNYREYQNWSLMSPIDACEIVINKNKFYIVFQQSFLRFPSGPVAYVFDEKGNVIDWSGDIGDDPDFYKRWDFQKEDKINIEEIDKVLLKDKQ